MIDQVLNPANGEVIAKVPNMKARETSAAIAAASSAFAEWKEKTAKERSKLMRKWVSVLVHMPSMSGCSCASISSQSLLKLVR